MNLRANISRLCQSLVFVTQQAVTFNQLGSAKRGSQEGFSRGVPLGEGKLQLGTRDLRAHAYSAKTN